MNRKVRDLKLVLLSLNCGCRRLHLLRSFRYLLPLVDAVDDVKYKGYKTDSLPDTLNLMVVRHVAGLELPGISASRLVQ